MKYETNDPELLKYEMREKSKKELRSIYHSNAPKSTLHAIHGEAALARHRAAYTELKKRS